MSEPGSPRPSYGARCVARWACDRVLVSACWSWRAEGQPCCSCRGLRWPAARTGALFGSPMSWPDVGRPLSPADVWMWGRAPAHMRARCPLGWPPPSSSSRAMRDRSAIEWCNAISGWRSSRGCAPASLTAPDSDRDGRVCETLALRRGPRAVPYCSGQRFRFCARAGAGHERRSPGRLFTDVTHFGASPTRPKHRR